MQRYGVWHGGVSLFRGFLSSDLYNYLTGVPHLIEHKILFFLQYSIYKNTKILNTNTVCYCYYFEKFLYAIKQNIGSLILNPWILYPHTFSSLHYLIQMWTKVQG
jgi:uncharacterized membrane protein